MPKARDNRARRRRANRRLEAWRWERVYAAADRLLAEIEALRSDALLFGMTVVEQRADGSQRRVPPHEWPEARRPALRPAWAYLYEVPS